MRMMQIRSALLAWTLAVALVPAAASAQGSTVTAREIETPDEADDRLADLERRVRELERLVEELQNEPPEFDEITPRLEALEKRTTALEAPRPVEVPPPRRPAGEAAATVEAPFVVTGSNGAPLLTVDEGGIVLDLSGGEDAGLLVRRDGRDVAYIGAGEGGGGTVATFSVNGGVSSNLGTGGESGAGVLILNDAGGEEMAVLGGKQRALRVLKDGRDRVVVGDDEAGDSGVHLKAPSTTIAFGTFQGRPDALRVFADGKQLVSLGASGGLGIVNVGNGNGVSAQMSATADGGDVSVYAGGKPGASLHTSGRGSHAMVYNTGGTPVAYLGPSSTAGGGNVTVTDGSGNGVFSAGAASDGQGEACVNRIGGGGGRTHCLGVGLPGIGGGGG